MPEEEKKILNYPSNSHKTREEARTGKTAEPRKKTEKIIKGNVVQRKKSLGKKFFETFVGEDVSNVGSYIVYDILIPAAKDTIYNMITGGLNMSLFNGNRRDDRMSRDRGRSYVSYDRVSRDDRKDDRRNYNNRNKSNHDFGDIILSSKGEAEEVLSNLVDLTIDYGEATVADLYGFVGIEESYTDRKYGWKDLSSAYVERVRDGYMINLPRTRPLD